jgi:hypothetical protein
LAVGPAAVVVLTRAASTKGVISMVMATTGVKLAAVVTMVVACMVVVTIGTMMMGVTVSWIGAEVGDCTFVALVAARVGVR